MRASLASASLVSTRRRVEAAISLLHGAGKGELRGSKASSPSNPHPQRALRAPWSRWAPLELVPFWGLKLLVGVPPWSSRCAAVHFASFSPSLFHSAMQRVHTLEGVHYIPPKVIRDQDGKCTTCDKAEV